MTWIIKDQSQTWMVLTPPWEICINEQDPRMPGMDWTVPHDEQFALQKCLLLCLRKLLFKAIYIRR